MDENNNNDNYKINNRGDHERWWIWALGGIIAFALLIGVSGLYRSGVQRSLDNAGNNAIGNQSGLKIGANKVQDGINGVQNGVQNGVNGLQNGADDLQNGAQNGLNNLQNGAQNGINRLDDNGTQLNTATGVGTTNGTTGELKKYTENIINTQLAQTTTNGKMKLRNIVVAKNKSDNQKNDIEINLNSGANTLGNMTQDEISTDVHKILTALSARKDVNTIAINEFALIENANGKSLDKKVFTLITTLDKIKNKNLDGISFRNLSDISTSFEIDPSINK